ncbi:DeoR family transcriptional regulator [Pseudactinotalea sp. HY160]|nr:DeoR/GlpR family DNA-binding transcription regulator [Pseudactinotalea sp. HY158]MPV51329.1 DeoR family transcriptional regulator [Pseudactinotalea sp. HY160]QGH69968.1 DeoR family transcriptional regulator [Pseudactinotalea sp. HY158]
MLVTERRRRVLEEVRRKGAVTVTDLSERLGVSGMTIRRDLEALAGDGMLEKVHGGATVRHAPSAEELDFDETSQQRRAEKEAIAERAAQLVQPGMSVGVSAGSTTWTFARHLRGISDLTIVTNSLRIAEEFRRTDPDRTVVITGGVRTPSEALVGPVAVRALQVLHCDVLFLGVHGVDLRAGLTTPNLMEAETNRALVASAQQLVVLADHSKFGRVGLSTIVELNAVDTLVTDSGVDPEALEVVGEQVGELITVAAPGQ